jgi:hypothetical protein
MLDRIYTYSCSLSDIDFANSLFGLLAVDCGNFDMDAFMEICVKQTVYDLKL